MNWDAVQATCRSREVHGRTLNNSKMHRPASGNKSRLRDRVRWQSSGHQLPARRRPASVEAGRGDDRPVAYWDQARQPACRIAPPFRIPFRDDSALPAQTIALVPQVARAPASRPLLSIPMWQPQLGTPHGRVLRVPSMATADLDSGQWPDQILQATA